MRSSSSGDTVWQLVGMLIPSRPAEVTSRYSLATTARSKSVMTFASPTTVPVAGPVGTILQADLGGQAEDLDRGRERRHVERTGDDARW